LDGRKKAWGRERARESTGAAKKKDLMEKRHKGGDIWETRLAERKN